LPYSYPGEPVGGPLPVYKALLEANLFWLGTSGTTLSLERETGGVILVYPLPVQALDLPTFRAGELHQDGGCVDGAAGTPIEAGATQPPEPISGPMMRV
jgi:Tir chaperone protein (CesT) family